jgi:hypothetical protein
MTTLQKICPRCNSKHTKKGTFCSRSCANVREHTEQDKEVRRKKLIEYHETPEGKATREKASRFITAQNRGEEFNEVQVEEWAVDIPTFRSLDDYEEFLDGFQKGENW